MQAEGPALRAGPGRGLEGKRISGLQEQTLRSHGGASWSVAGSGFQPENRRVFRTGRNAATSWVRKMKARMDWEGTRE